MGWDELSIGLSGESRLKWEGIENRLASLVLASSRVLAVTNPIKGARKLPIIHSLSIRRPDRRLEASSSSSSILSTASSFVNIFRMYICMNLSV